VTRLRVCAERGCARLTDQTRCAQHQQPGNPGWQTRRGNEHTRIRGRTLKRLRERLFTDEPFCRLCKVRLAEIRDHIVPLAEGGSEDLENTQPLCRLCSDAKTQAEARRGRERF
jgi:5-methylcytosine-specific restriction enzyme A